MRTTPRRYRLSLLAYPRRWRDAHGDDIRATLADGDDARGTPSWREARALALNGAAVRLRPVTAARAQQRLLAFGALSLLTASVLPARAWAERSLGSGVPVLDGPPPSGRTLLAAVALAVLSILSSRRLRSAYVAAACTLALTGMIAFAVVWSRTSPRPPTFAWHLLAEPAAAASCVAVAVALLASRTARLRRLVCATALLAVAIEALISAMTLTGPAAGGASRVAPWHLGPGGALTLAATASALLTFAGASMRDR